MLNRRPLQLLRKIDFAVLSFVCLMYWSNYLDRANLSVRFPVCLEISPRPPDVTFGFSGRTRTSPA